MGVPAGPGLGWTRHACMSRQRALQAFFSLAFGARPGGPADLASRADGGGTVRTSSGSLAATGGGSLAVPRRPARPVPLGRMKVRLSVNALSSSSATPMLTKLLTAALRLDLDQPQDVSLSCLDTQTLSFTTKFSAAPRVAASFFRESPAAPKAVIRRPGETVMARK